MTDFDIFDTAINIYKEEIKEKENEIDVDSENDTTDECEHKILINEKGIVNCADCGEQVFKEKSFNKEWRYYGNKDTKNYNDPTRVHTRKIVDKNIYGDVENMGFNHNIVELANQIYHDVTEDSIKRGNSRKGIVFACIFHAYKLSGDPQTYESLIKHFRLKKKQGLTGIKHVQLNSPKNSLIHTTFITPEHLIKEIMFKFERTTEKQYQEVISIYNKIRNKNTKLNRARPQSVAAGIVYFWIQKNKKNITLDEFTSMVNLSKLTIGKMTKIITNILEKPKNKL